MLKPETRKCKIIVSFTTRIVTKFRRAIVRSCLSFYTAGYWSLGTVVYLFKVTFSLFSRSFAYENYWHNFFLPCSPSATCIRLPVYFLLIAWAKCPGGKMFSPKLNYSSAMSGYCRIDCLQSAFSLKIRLVLDLIQRDCKPRCYYIGIETRRSRFSRQEASPLACLGFACSNFAKKNKRLLAV